MKLVKRKMAWVYPPLRYGMFCDKCRGVNITWSEYEQRIWCYDCKIDTEGEGWPLDLAPFEASKMMIGPLCYVQLRFKDKALMELQLKDGHLYWRKSKNYVVKDGKITEVKTYG